MLTINRRWSVTTASIQPSWKQLDELCHWLMRGSLCLFIFFLATMCSWMCREGLSSFSFSNLRAWHFQFLIKGTSCACCMRHLSVLLKSQTAAAATLASVSLESLLCGAVFVAYIAIKCRRNRRRLRGASNTMAFIAQSRRVVAVSSVWSF